MEGPWGPRSATYMDYAASGRMLRSFDDFMHHHVHPYYANTHSETSDFGKKMTELVQHARQQVGAAVGAPAERYAVIFTGNGSTAAIDRVCSILMRKDAEQHANAAHSTGGSAVDGDCDAAGGTADGGDAAAEGDNKDVAAAADAGTACMQSATAMATLSATPTRPRHPPAAVFIGPFEHHSNMLLWREALCELVVIPEDSAGRVDLAGLERELKARRQADPQRMLIGSFSAGSNVSGITAQVDEIAELMHTHAGMAFFDYAAAASYVDIEMEPLGRPLAYKDGIYLSPHKFIGGPGASGVLVARRDLFDPMLPPSHPGGGSVTLVTPHSHFYDSNAEAREEAGTPNILGNIRCGLAFGLWREAMSHMSVHQKEEMLAKRAIQGLAAVPGVVLLGGDKPAYHQMQGRLGIISFVVALPPHLIHSRHEGKPQLLHHHFVATLLNDLYGLQLRSGCSCAGPYAFRLFEPIFAPKPKVAPATCAASTGERTLMASLPTRGSAASSIDQAAATSGSNSDADMTADVGDAPAGPAPTHQAIDQEGMQQQQQQGPAMAKGAAVVAAADGAAADGASYSPGEHAMMEAASYVAAGNGCMKTGWTRASLKFVTIIEEVDYMVAAVKQIAEHGWRLLPFYQLDHGSGSWTLRQHAPPLLPLLPSDTRAGAAGAGAAAATNMVTGKKAVVFAGDAESADDDQDEGRVPRFSCMGSLLLRRRSSGASGAKGAAAASSLAPLGSRRGSVSGAACSVDTSSGTTHIGGRKSRTNSGSKSSAAEAAVTAASGITSNTRYQPASSDDRQQDIVYSAAPIPTPATRIGGALSHIRSLGAMLSSAPDRVTTAPLYGATLADAHRHYLSEASRIFKQAGTWTRMLVEQHQSSLPGGGQDFCSMPAALLLAHGKPIIPDFLPPSISSTHCTDIIASSGSGCGPGGQGCCAPNAGVIIISKSNGSVHDNVVLGGLSEDAEALRWWMQPSEAAVWMLAEGADSAVPSADS